MKTIGKEEALFTADFQALFSIYDLLDRSGYAPNKTPY